MIRPEKDKDPGQQGGGSLPAKLKAEGKRVATLVVAVGQRPKAAHVSPSHNQALKLLVDPKQVQP